MQELILVEKLEMEDHFTNLNKWDDSQAFYPTARIGTQNGRLMMTGSEGNMDYLLVGMRKVNDVNLTLGVKMVLTEASAADIYMAIRIRIEIDNTNSGFSLTELVNEVFPNFKYNAADVTRLRHQINATIPNYLEYLIPMTTDIAYSTFLAHLHQFRGMEAVKSPEEVKEYFKEIATKYRDNAFKKQE